MEDEIHNFFQQVRDEVDKIKLQHRRNGNRNLDHDCFATQIYLDQFKQE